MKRRPGGLTVVFVPDESGESRSFRLSPRGLRVSIILGTISLVAVGVMVASWWYFALHAANSWQLQALVDSLQAERVQILSLAEELGRVESEYERIRLLFGPAEAPIASDLWLPPSGLPGSRSVGEGPESEDYLPTSWPLTESGVYHAAAYRTGRWRSSGDGHRDSHGLLYSCSRSRAGLAGGGGSHCMASSWSWTTERGTRRSMLTPRRSWSSGVKPFVGKR